MADTLLRANDDQPHAHFLFCIQMSDQVFPDLSALAMIFFIPLA